MRTAFPDISPERLADVAAQVRTAPDATLPPLGDWFNSDPCVDHLMSPGVPVEGCKHCGVLLKKHQRIATLWMYFAMRCGLFDQYGLGKTASAAATIALAAQRGEMGLGRILIVCRPAALEQWRDELARMLPWLSTAIIDGPWRTRQDLYADPWQAMIIGYQMLRRDAHIIERLGIRWIITDDIDELRHSKTKTALVVKNIALRCVRVNLLTASPLQKKVEELYDLLTLVGAQQVLGTKSQFKNRYVVKVRPVIRTQGLTRETQDLELYRRRLTEFAELISPYVLRRTTHDVEGDVSMPEVEAENIFLDLHPAQRERYDELARGVVRLLKEEGESVKRATALTKLLYGSQICEGLSALGELDGPGMSVKMDWLLYQILENDWSGESDVDFGEKVVVFCQFKPGVRALVGRLQNAGIGGTVVWGEDRDRQRRVASLARFDQDPACRVLIGTAAIEQSLNLQVSRRLVNLDQIPNPERMNQLAGRIRRMGSRHSTVYVSNLLTSNTHEERLLALLNSEAALKSFVWSETDPIYNPLTPTTILRSIAGD